MSVQNSTTVNPVNTQNLPQVNQEQTQPVVDVKAIEKLMKIHLEQLAKAKKSNESAKKLLEDNQSKKQNNMESIALFQNDTDEHARIYLAEVTNENTGLDSTIAQNQRDFDSSIQNLASSIGHVLFIAKKFFPVEGSGDVNRLLKQLQDTRGQLSSQESSDLQERIFKAVNRHFGIKKEKDNREKYENQHRENNEVLAEVVVEGGLEDIEENENAPLITKQTFSNLVRDPIDLIRTDNKCFDLIHYNETTKKHEIIRSSEYIEVLKRKAKTFYSTIYVENVHEHVGGMEELKKFRKITLSRDVGFGDFIPLRSFFDVIHNKSGSVRNQMIDLNSLRDYLLDENNTSGKKELENSYWKKHSIILMFPIDFQDDTVVSVQLITRKIFAPSNWEVAAGNWLNWLFGRV